MSQFDRRYRQCSRVSFGLHAATVRTVEPSAARGYHAFAVQCGGRPRVFSYDDDEDGVAALANLIRAEEVLGVVYGRKIQFMEESSVKLDFGGKIVENDLRVKGSNS